MKLKVIFILVTIIGIGLLHLFSKVYFDSSLYYKIASNEESYGQNLNAKRDKYGIPLLEEDWFTKDLTFKRINPFRSGIKENKYWKKQIWSSFSSLKNKGYHKSKTLVRDINYNLSYEIDTFKLETIERTFYLITKCPVSKTKDCKINFVDQKLSKSSTVQSVNVQFADSVLESWELRIPNW